MPKKRVRITTRIASADESNDDRDEPWLEEFLNMIPAEDSPIRLDTDFDLLDTEIEVNNS